MHSALAGESDTARSSHPSSAFELSVLSLSSYTQDREGYIIAAGLFPLLYTSNSSFWCGALLLLLLLPDDAVDVNSIVGG